MDPPSGVLDTPGSGKKKSPAKRKPRAKPSAISSTSKDETEHIYIVTSPEMRLSGKFKVGFHTGDRDKLLHRYVTALNQVELVMFIRGTLSEEQTVHDRLASYRVPNHNGKASEWYSIPERTLIAKVIDILNGLSIVEDSGVAGNSVSVEPGAVVSSPRRPEDDRYLGPLKFLHACEDSRWDLVREWLNSREYKQDKHLRSKLQRKGEKEFQSEAIRWNDAHQWIVCLERLCGAVGVPMLVVELLLGYCDRRWVRAMSWAEPSEAREVGYAAAKRADNGPVLTYLQTWGAGDGKVGEKGMGSEGKVEIGVEKVKTEGKIEKKVETGREIETEKIERKAGPVIVVKLQRPKFLDDEIELSEKQQVDNSITRSLVRENVDLISDARTDSVLIQAVALSVGEAATYTVAKAVCTILHRGEMAAKSALQKIMERDAGVIITAAVHAAEAHCIGILYKFVGLGVSVRQISGAAVLMCNRLAVDFLVLNMGASWSAITGDAAALWALKGDRSMVDYIGTKGTINWDHALIMSAIHGKLGLIKHFVSLGAKRVDVALDRALKANGSPEVIEYLCGLSGSQVAAGNHVSLGTDMGHGTNLRTGFDLFSP